MSKQKTIHSKSSWKVQVALISNLASIVFFCWKAIPFFLITQFGEERNPFRSQHQFQFVDIGSMEEEMIVKPHDVILVIPAHGRALLCALYK